MPISKLDQSRSAMDDISKVKSTTDKGKQVASPPSTSLIFNRSNISQDTSPTRLKCTHKPAPVKHSTSMQSNRQPSHASYCRDPDCEGCDVGQVELDLPEEVLKDPLRLWELAQSEILRETPSSDSEDEKGTSNSRETAELDDDMQDAVVAKLLDLAIEHFEMINRKKTPAEAICYGRCLVERGKLLDSTALVDKGINILEACLADHPDIKDAAGTWAVIGKARVEQVYSRISDANTTVLSEDSEHDLLDSDDEDEAVGTSTNAVTSSKALLQHGISCIEKGLELRSDEVAKDRARMSLCRWLTDTAALIRSRSQADLALHLVNHAAMIARPYVISAPVLAAHWHAILGRNYFFTARIGRWILQNQAKREASGSSNESSAVVNGAAFDDIRTIVNTLDKIADYVDEAIVNLAQAIEIVHQDRYEGRPIPKRSWIVNVDYHLGQANLLKSSMRNTPDDVAVDAYEDGIRALMRCLQMEPNNENVRQQLEAMGVLNDNDQSDDLANSEDIRSPTENESDVLGSEDENDETKSDSATQNGENSSTDLKHGLANGSVDTEDSRDEDSSDDNDQTRPAKRRKANGNGTLNADRE